MSLQIWVRLCMAFVCLCCFCHAMVGSHGAGHTQVQAKPNFIIIMADDQDMHLGSLDYMPNVQKHFAEKGSWFKRHYCTVSQCCPSRISLWTGKAAHNTNVTDVVLPYGTRKQSSRLEYVMNVVDDDVRRISAICSQRLERQLSASLASGCWIQNILRRQTHQ